MTDISSNEVAQKLYQLSKHSPRVAQENIGTIRTFLSANEANVQLAATETLRNIAIANPKAVVPAVDDLETLLYETRDEQVKARVLYTLAEVALENPSEVCSVVNQIEYLLTDERTEVQLGAIWTLNNVALDCPEDAVSAIDDIQELLSADDERIRTHAVLTLACIGLSYPEDVKPAIPEIKRLRADESESVRDGAKQALKNIQTDPNASAKPMNDGRGENGTENMRRVTEGRSIDSQSRDAVSSESTAAVSVEYVSTLAELIEYKIETTRSADDCRMHVEELRDVLLEMDVDEATYHDHLTELETEIDRLQDSSLPNELGEERRKRLKTAVHRIKKFSERNVN